MDASSTVGHRITVKLPSSHLRYAHGFHEATHTQLRHLHQGRAAVPEASEARAGALHRTTLHGVCRMRDWPYRKAGRARRSMVAGIPARTRFCYTLGPV